MKSFVGFFTLSVLGLSRALVTTTSGAASPAECCRQQVYPENKIWISAEGNKIKYNFYDTYSLVSKISAYEVDQSGNLGKTRILDVDPEVVTCPANHRTSNPKHAELTKSPSSRILCVNKDDKLKQNKWYGVCRERTCTSCHLDRMAPTETAPEYLSIKSAKTRGNSLIIDFEVKNPGVSYNVTMEIGIARDTLTEFTVEPTQRTHTLQVPNVSDNVYRYPIYVFVDPFVKSTGCPVFGRRQITVLPPFTR